MKDIRNHQISKVNTVVEYIADNEMYLNHKNNKTFIQIIVEANQMKRERVLQSYKRHQQNRVYLSFYVKINLDMLNEILGRLYCSIRVKSDGSVHHFFTILLLVFLRA
ncbi:UNKNOWN [Stylonychia lemnae]|uniref:Uncharacterized protein n=1 Tax=Stylonychia lemnae TaxID=5949 RepID=A0A078AGM1_STYLE|nr:UNKNOWN [Stylonychia lemnae]|eukprot:CDW80003.1 UNKNOWN [Stylonychia lemnae]